MLERISYKWDYDTNCLKPTTLVSGTNPKNASVPSTTAEVTVSGDYNQPFVDVVETVATSCGILSRATVPDMEDKRRPHEANNRPLLHQISPLAHIPGMAYRIPRP